MKCWRSRLVVNVLILLAITLATVVRCQDEQQATTTDVADGGTAAGADDVKDDPSTRTSGESFVAIHVDALGTKEQLRPSLRGLSYIAISFLPRDFTLQEVQSATREVVAGVRYELVVKALDREQSEVLCKLTVLEKPWLTTESGDKYRILEYSNCTSGEDTTETTEVVTKLNPIFDPNVRAQQEMSPSRFKDLVSQIIIEKKIEASSTPTPAVSTTTTEHSTAPVLSESSKDVLDQLFMFGSEAQPPRRVADNSNDSDQTIVEEMIVPKRVTPPQSQLTTTEVPPLETTTISLDQQVQSTFEEVFKTHQEIQKALDEVIQRGGGRDVQQKYEPVFASLLQKVKTSIDNYYQTIHPGGGDANVDTAAFVIRDSKTPVQNSTPAAKPNDDQHSSESNDLDDQQQQQVILPDFNLLPSQPSEAPPKIDSVVMHFSDDSDEQQHEDVQRPQTREELIRDLNTDDSQQRNKRAPGSHSYEHDFSYHNPFYGSHSHESYEHYGHRPFYGHNPYNNFNPYFNPYSGPDRYPYYTHHRGKRFVEMDLKVADEKQTSEVEKMISEAIEMLDHMDADLFKRVLLEVISVKRINQFSSAVEQKGDLYVARVLTANSHCVEEVEDSAKCKSLLIDGSNKFCTLEIRAKDKEVRLVKSECVPNKLMGGHHEVDLSEPEHQQRIQAGLKGYAKGKLRNSRFVIRCGTVQIVAGTIHRYTVDLVDKDQQVLNTCNVKIYTPLQDAPEYSFDCQEVSRRVARDVERKKLSKGPKTGAPMEMTPEEFGKPEHAERIQSILLTAGGANTERKYKIVEATQQIVAGSLYTYKLIFTDDPDKRVCKLTSHERPWLKEKSPSEARKVSFSCPEAPNSRSKRSICAGCPSALSPNDLQDVEHKQRVNKILLANVVGSQGELESLSPQIINATSKVVQGTLYTYFVSFKLQGAHQICELTAWERPWLDDSEAYKYTASCAEQDDSNALRKRSKRSFCVGCPTAITNLQEGDHRERVVKILLAKVAGSEDQLQSMSPEIINATSQVVQGTLYTYFVAYRLDDSHQVCKLTSWERPWLDGAEAYQYTAECGAAQGDSNTLRKRRSVSRSKRGFGSARVLTAEELQQDEHVKRVDAILASSPGANVESPRIVNGTVQVVAGHSYTYYIAYTVNGEERVCKLNSWERPWLEDKQPSEAYKRTVQCDGTDESSVARARRHAKKTGASNELSAEDLKDKSHVERIKAGLVAYNTEKSKSYDEFEIVKGSVQLVAGSLYKYTFKVKSEPEVICKISVWERVWLDAQDQRKYNVKCDGDDEPEQEQKLAASKRSARSVRPRQSDSDGEGHYSKGEDHARHLFEKFKLKHSREYQSTLEHEMRFRIFKNNLFKIEQLNKYEQGTAKYGITHFADMTSAEYRQRTGLVIPRDEDRNHVGNPKAEIDENMELPESFDWRELGAVSPVKNQGNCGSCWAFSVVGNIEGLHQIKTKILEEYSEQELLDCDAVDSACQGGYMDDAYKAIEKIGGLELESEYPYLAKKQKTCHFNSTEVHVRVKGAVDLPKNETAMAQYLVANGPISIGLNANAMQFYRGGISHPWKPLCSKKNLDHGVLIVGYGVKEYPMFNKTMPYWIVKNSWGPKWGEQGYYRIFRGDNTCGVSEMASSAVLA
ncbi:uncharacterized protein LOC23687573 isoform X2 [Aedes aegypti]|uniref:Cysteine proteinase n=1 Tax=Aedes aegypti TaxID=7159 RepID=A0A6I8UA62_AEDAE|nr:uncharacterized protein LOC23687573 isoform X2 [Aedes aegypti]